MLVLTTMLPAAQASKLATTGGPCVQVGPGGVLIGECNYGGSTANSILTGNHPGTSSSSSFTGVNATAVLEDVRVTWSFNESSIDANVTAFHVQRGLDPRMPGTMERVATLGPDAEGYLDEDAMVSGDVWYVVTVHLEDGTTEQSTAFRVNSVQT